MSLTKTILILISVSHNRRKRTVFVESDHANVTRFLFELRQSDSMILGVRRSDDGQSLC